MARMFPKRWLYGHDRSSGKEAERKVYDALSLLPQDFAVYHGVQFSVRKPGQPRRDVEIDFIVSHRDKGALVIEVKSGTISLRHREWRRNLGGERSEAVMPEPPSQLRDNVHDLERHLAERDAWRGKRADIGGALCFPDTKASWPADDAEPPNAIVATGPTLRQIQAWVDGAFAYCAVAISQRC